MPKFTFRLSPLLRLREAFRDERQMELADAYRADDVLKEHLEASRGELVVLAEGCRRAVGPGPVDIDRLLTAQRYEAVLEAQVQHILQQRELVAQEIERRRQALVHANREVRVLEKLREHQADRYMQEESLRDIKRLDEVAQQRAAREEAQ
jgi:flagellar protein FliJ